MFISREKEERGMDSVEDQTATTVILKGKRTKRLRDHSLPPAPARSPPSSSAAAISASTTTDEEEDMANCLILLARGHRDESSETQPDDPVGAPTVIVSGAGNDKLSAGGNGGGSRRFAEASSTTTGKAGFYVYECKTCNKSFTSFQALGGHRASHKKPKLAAGNKVAITRSDKTEFGIDEASLQISLNSFSLPVTPLAGAGAAKMKVHECSICGAEFSSGQALGGHMRRHRPLGLQDTSASESKKERNVLPLDLNLPATSDDDRAGDFARPPMIFSASSLVDCHY